MIMAHNGVVHMRLCNGQATVLYAFCTDKRIRDLPNFPRLSAQYDDFQAMIVIQMDMKRGHYVVVILMLQLGQFFTQKTHVVVVDQRHRADHMGIGRLR